ncbi:DDE-type integrase/transposase/recombinase [Brenneria izbisi]|uniref:DDE-type integrase/transposase/recombinase n=1 Tax=Brenneria izbisi TaxID=2939450 RepID=UPI00384CE49F
MLKITRSVYYASLNPPMNTNLLKRRVMPSEPNRMWRGDINYIKVNGDWVYLALVIDLYSRRIVGIKNGEKRPTILALTEYAVTHWLNRFSGGLNLAGIMNQ